MTNADSAPISIIVGTESTKSRQPRTQLWARFAALERLVERRPPWNGKRWTTEDGSQCFTMAELLHNRLGEYNRHNQSMPIAVCQDYGPGPCLHRFWCFVSRVALRCRVLTRNST